MHPPTESISSVDASTQIFEILCEVENGQIEYVAIKQKIPIAVIKPYTEQNKTLTQQQVLNPVAP